jgi:hypothetical protein
MVPIILKSALRATGTNATGIRVVATAVTSVFIGEVAASKIFGSPGANTEQRLTVIAAKILQRGSYLGTVFTTLEHTALIFLGVDNHESEATELAGLGPGINMPPVWGKDP